MFFGVIIFKQAIIFRDGVRILRILLLGDRLLRGNWAAKGSRSLGWGTKSARIIVCTQASL
jgi:hypothetical protein